MSDNTLALLVYTTKGLLSKSPNPYVPVAYTHLYGDEVWQIVVSRVPTAGKQVA